MYLVSRNISILVLQYFIIRIQTYEQMASD